MIKIAAADLVDRYQANAGPLATAAYLDFLEKGEEKAAQIWAALGDAIRQYQPPERDQMH
ncbi:MAG: hypothetical protein AAGF15_10530 [Pseudomonadota bacterium]